MTADPCFFPSGRLSFHPLCRDGPRTDIHFIGANDVPAGRPAGTRGVCRDRHSGDPAGSCYDGLCRDGGGRGVPNAGGGVGGDVRGNLPTPDKDEPGRASYNNSNRDYGSQTIK